MLVSENWRAVRPADVVETFEVSAGQPRDLVGTGLAEITQARYPDLRAIERGGTANNPWHIIWISSARNHALIDLAEVLTWDGQGSPLGSSAFLGKDLADLAGRGVRHLHINLPQLMRFSDAGQGILTELTGKQLDGADPLEVSQAISVARETISQLTVYTTYSAPVKLTGFSGMAHSWAEKGLDPQTAQQAQQELGQWIAAVTRALELDNRLLLEAEPAPRSAYAGAGGGLAMMLEALRSRVLPIGTYLFGMHPEINRAISQSELCCYVSGKIGINIPSPLTELSDRTSAHGIPLVLVADSAGMRKGELPNLGIHGAYELRPELAYLPDQLDDPHSSVDISHKLAKQIQKTAMTWGY